MSGPNASTQPKRDEALDAAKGVAILAVLIFHMTRGFVSSGQLMATPGLQLADTIAYGFHVQIFLLIAGYLAYPSANRPGFQFRRQLWLYYAYLLWSVISWILGRVAAGSVNNPPTIASLLVIPFEPIQHFWFLLVLMMGTALLAVLRDGKWLLAGCVALIALVPAQPHLPAPLHLLSSVFFVLLGGWLRAKGLRLPAIAPVALLCGLALLTGAWQASATGRSMTFPSDLPFMLCGCYAAFCLAAAAVRLPIIGPFLCYCGHHSLSIYLIHVIAGSGTRIMLAKTMPTLPVIVALLLSIIAGLLGPLVIEWVARRLGLATLIALDPPMRRRPKPTSA